MAVVEGCCKPELGVCGRPGLCHLRETKHTKQNSVAQFVFLKKKVEGHEEMGNGTELEIQVD